jgi:hypothetical protein
LTGRRGATGRDGSGPFDTRGRATRAFRRPDKADGRIGGDARTESVPLRDSVVLRR